MRKPTAKEKETKWQKSFYYSFFTRNQTRDQITRSTRLAQGWLWIICPNSTESSPRTQPFLFSKANMSPQCTSKFIKRWKINRRQNYDWKSKQRGTLVCIFILSTFLCSPSPPIFCPLAVDRSYFISHFFLILYFPAVHFILVHYRKLMWLSTILKANLLRSLCV